MDKSLLRTLGVTHVLNVASQLPNYHEGSFVYLKLPMVDAVDVSLAQYLPSAFKFLSRVEEMNGRVLVHCVAGVSRSVIIVTLFLIAMHKLDLHTAYSFIKTVR